MSLRLLSEPTRHLPELQTFQVKTWKISISWSQHSLSSQWAENLRKSFVGKWRQKFLTTLLIMIWICDQKTTDITWKLHTFSKFLPPIFSHPFLKNLWPLSHKLASLTSNLWQRGERYKGFMSPPLMTLLIMGIQNCHHKVTGCSWSDLLRRTAKYCSIRWAEVAVHLTQRWVIARGGRRQSFKDSKSKVF